MRYLKEKEVADLTGYSLSKLRSDRHQSRGMPYVKDGKSVRYRLHDVENYMNDRLIIPPYSSGGSL